MKIKNLTKKVWVETCIEDLENREEFAIGNACPMSYCYVYCPGYGCPLNGLCPNYGMCPDLHNICILKFLCPSF